MRIWTLTLALVVGAILVATAIATPSSGVVAETSRGTLDERLNANTRFDNGARVKLQTKGPIELITQRIVAEPGATFGWHTHPGVNVNVVQSGTLTLYHDKRCTTGMDYGPGTAFTTEGVHLARNESATETLIVYASYFAPKTTPALPVRVDQPSPGAGCPQ